MKIIGHRGARGLAPENTIASLQKALLHHVDLIEFDVRVTADKVVVLLHDSHLTDASGTKLQVVDHSYDELRQHKPDLATLAEALATIGTAARPYIEVKQRVETAPIVKIIQASGLTNLVIGSKNQKTLRELHAALPAVDKIIIEPWSGVRAGYRARQVDTKLVAMNQLWLWSGFIRSVRHSGWELYAYTLNDPAKAKRWHKHGLAGVITDYPDRY